MLIRTWEGISHSFQRGFQISSQVCHIRRINHPGEKIYCIYYISSVSVQSHFWWQIIYFQLPLFITILDFRSLFVSLWCDNFWHKIHKKICTYYTDQPNCFLICTVLHKEGIVEHVLFVGYILVIFLWPNSPRLFWTKVVAALKVNAVQIWSANNIAQFSSLCFFLSEFQWEKNYFLHWAFSSWISVRKTILPNICCAVNVLHSHNFRQSRVISSDWRNLIKSNLERGKNIHCNI